jgi:energy-coupling factor transporter transmembrane protein EcfT
MMPIESPSTAAQIIVTVIPIVGIVMGALVLFFYIYYNHKQKLAMIEKGTFRKLNFDLNIFSLFTGLLLFIFGFFLTIFFLVKEGFGYSLLSGIIPLACGLSLLIYYTIRMILNNKTNAE